jgi:hypothetical protein
MTEDESERCWTIGCDNEPIVDGYCAECADISPGILDSDDESGTDESGKSDSDSPVEDGSDDANPGFESDKSAARARAAFADAIEWFHSQLDRDISDLGLTYIDTEGNEQPVETAREWFHEVRGWSDETIDTARLGWASANRTGLLDHLMREGYGRGAILGTGLFTENLRPLWQGRFVFPYFDTDGQPVYGISRATGNEGGGAVGYDGHPDDGLSGKYAKPAHTKEYARVEEPIFGLDSIEDGQPVLITEGIADAITAQQAGYACISPVTTRFKREDREALREALDDHDVPRAYVVQDAERPSSDLDEDDRLSLTQVGEGLRGALDTAAYLAEHDTDAQVAELPRPGLDKVDLDDYLREWSSDGTLAPLLASAKPAREHPAYDPQNAALAAADRDRTDPLGDSTSDDHSALFDLDIRDASGLDADYRGASPLGHHGESEKYFVVIEKRDVAYDHKYKAAYTPLTYLLVEADERSPDDPNGRLDDSEMFAAWFHAKREGIILDDDPIPRRALRHVAVDHGHCESSEIEDGWKFPSDAYDAALDTLTDEYDVEPGRDPLSTGWGYTPDEVDPTTLDVVLDPETAWQAAWMIRPDSLDTALNHEPTDDGERWQCPQCGGEIGVVQAVALHLGSIDCCEEPLKDDEYDAAYRRARERFGAPLPEYVDTTTATDNWALVQSAVAQLTHWHLSALDSTVTGLADGNDDVIAEINPTWEESSTEKRILAFRSGAFYCREHDCTIDPLRIAALEQGIIDECDDALAGEDFTEAYHVAREQYGAPLPEWNTGNPDHVPVLPRADDLLGEFTTDRDALNNAREDVEELYAELATDTRKAWMLRSLPATGKTTSVVKLADEYPALYLTSRNELQQEVAAKADQWGHTSMHLPIFAEHQPNEGAVGEATALVREEGKDLLRDPEDLVERIEAPVTIEEEDDVPDEDEINLERASCATANGAHDEAWQLAVHVARELGHSPQDIHQRDTELFGAELPCHADHECGYKLGWDRATDPDNPKDILIGHYVHGHVEGAKKYVSREDEQTWVQERVIAIDEFPGDVYERSFGEEFLDHAAWLGKALSAEVDDRQDLFETDLWDDDLVRAWLRGNATTEIDALAEVDQRLEVMQRLCDALTTVEDLRTDGSTEETTEGTDGDEDALAAALASVQTLGPTWDATAIDNVHEALRAAVGSADRQTQNRIENDVLPALAAARRALDDGDSLSATTAPDRLGGDLSTMVENAVEAFCEGNDGARGLLTGARTALAGGEEGCRELAIHARDGYAHPLAHLLLHGTIAEGDAATEVPTEAFDFDEESDSDGTNLKSVQRERETMLIDRNHHGASVRNPPALRSGDHPNPVVGLDATGRERLWEHAIGCEVEARDIHDSARERRAFLRDVLNLQVVQTSPHTKTYSGSPGGKNFDGDVALIQEIAEKFAATQLRQDTLTATTKPGVITTKKVEQEIASRVEDDIAAIDHYGNITGSNALGELNLGAVLGCRHFGDAVVEKWAAFAGESIYRAGHGADLNYDSATANTYLKHMREDQTLQAILRFGRDQEGAVVFAHTTALSESLPIVADGAVVKAFSKSKRAVTRAAREYRGQQFAVSDIAPEVDCDKRTVRRALNEFADLGYLEKHETKNGLANSYRTNEEPGVGEADLPDLDEPFAPADGPESASSGRGGSSGTPDGSPSSVSSTGFVWVVGGETDAESGYRRARATLPAPDATDSAESAAPPG